MKRDLLIKYFLKPKHEPLHRFAYIGVPHDAATTLGNPGSRFAPQAVREAMRLVFDWRLHDHKLADLDTGIVDLSSVEIADFGDISLSYHDVEKAVEETYQAVRGALEASYFPLIVGGDHSVTYPAVRALHDTCKGSIGLIQLDAHCDMMDYSDIQGRLSGSSPMRRSVELDRLAGPNLVQIGLRGYTTLEQYEFGQRLGVRRITAKHFAEIGAQASAKQALEWAKDGTEAVYMTIDMDVLNPGEAPGTGWPIPAGFTGQQILDFVRAVAPDINALDIAELNPLTDTRTGTTTTLGGQLLLDCITVRSTMTS